MFRRRHLTLGSIVVLAVVMGSGLVSGCNRDGDAAKRATRRNAFVVDRVVPIGKLTGAAANDGSLQLRELPGDLVPDDGVTSLDDLRCLVAARDLPAGTVLRRSMLVEPSKLGLPQGLTNDDGPTGCE